MEAGLYYLWNAKSYHNRIIASSVTQGTPLGIRKSLSSEELPIVFAFHLFSEGAPGYGKWQVANGKAYFSPSEWTLEKKSSLLELGELTDQFKEIKVIAQEQGDFTTMVKVLRQFERRAIWNEELFQILEPYFTRELELIKRLEKKKIEWLMAFIEKRKIDLEKIELPIQPFGPDGSMKIPTTFLKTTNKLVKFILQRIIYGPTYVQREDARSHSFRIIAKEDFVLSYPILKRFKDTDWNEILQQQELRREIELVWGMIK